MSSKAIQGPTTLKSEIEYDQTLMGLPLVMPAVFLIAKSFYVILSTAVWVNELWSGYRVSVNIV
jgi:hypothetical protein